MNDIEWEYSELKWEPEMYTSATGRRTTDGNEYFLIFDGARAIAEERDAEGTVIISEELVNQVPLTQDEIKDIVGSEYSINGNYTACLVGENIVVHDLEDWDKTYTTRSSFATDMRNPLFGFNPKYLEEDATQPVKEYSNKYPTLAFFACLALCVLLLLVVY